MPYLLGVDEWTAFCPLILNEGVIRMALNYLLDPAFEIVNTAGKPATGGKINVFIHGTRDKYYCASDFNGTLLPFDIPLDSLGSAVILADDSHAYDIYIYNRYGTLMMSRYNVQPKEGGGVSSQNITSTDGSVHVTNTADGVDLSVDGADPSVLRASGDTLTSDGEFTCVPLQQLGDKIIVDQNGKVKVEDGWYHYDIVTHFNYSGTPTNQTAVVVLKHGGLESRREVDLSYPNEGTIALSAEICNPSSGLEEFEVAVSGVPEGMSIELVELGIHSIHGYANGIKYNAGRNIDIDNETQTISFAPTRAWRSMHGSTWCDSGDVFGFLVDDAYHDPDGIITVVKGVNEDSEHNVTHWGEIHIAPNHAAMIVTSVTLYRKPDELQPTLNSIAFWYGGNPVSIYGARMEMLYDNSQMTEIVPQITGYIPATANGAVVTLGCSAGVPWYDFKPTELWVAALD